MDTNYSQRGRSLKHLCIFPFTIVDNDSKHVSLWFVGDLDTQMSDIQVHTSFYSLNWQDILIKDVLYIWWRVNV